MTPTSVRLGTELELGTRARPGGHVAHPRPCSEPCGHYSPGLQATLIDCFHRDFAALTCREETAESLFAAWGAEPSRATSRGGMLQGCCRATSPFCDPSGGPRVPPPPLETSALLFPTPRNPGARQGAGPSPRGHAFTSPGGAELSPPCSRAVVRGRWIGKETLGKRLSEPRAIPRGCSWWLRGDDVWEQAGSPVQRSLGLAWAHFRAGDAAGREQEAEGTFPRPH